MPGDVGGQDAAGLLRATVEALARHAPSIVADAALELGDTVLNLHFDDGSGLSMRRELNALRVRALDPRPTVEARFGVDWLRRLYDLQRAPFEALDPERFDAKGAASEVLAVWRTFRLLAQRGAGLRLVQSLWTAFRTARGIDAVGPRQEWPEKSTVSLRPQVPDAASLLRGTEAVSARTASVASTRVLWDGETGEGWWNVPGPRDADLREILARCLADTSAEIDRIIGHREPGPDLYDLMRDYPARGGKGLRPALCMATCGAFGGRPADTLRTCAAIEMFHNAFLIHDDIEDESDIRRGVGCLHVLHGIPLAVNTGDGLNLLAVDTVLSNIETLGLSRTLGLIHEIIHMCRETIEGQALELGWIRHGRVPLHDEDYFHMATKKTGWYTCMSPCRLGAIAAGHTRPAELDLIGGVFHKVGIAFQIQDDLLNLLGLEELYGKEPLGDLLEGKRTVMLIHLMRTLDEATRRDVEAWLSLPRREKKQSEAEWVLGLMERCGSIAHGRSIAATYAEMGSSWFERDLGFLPESESKAVLRQVAHYVNTREL